MRRYGKGSDGTLDRNGAPASTQEGREIEVASLAYDLAERQIREGTASAQVLTYFLKLGSQRERLERDILIEQRKLVKAKTESMESAKRTEELYTNAIEAMRLYSGNGDGGNAQLYRID